MTLNPVSKIEAYNDGKFFVHTKWCPRLYTTSIPALAALIYIKYKKSTTSIFIKLADPKEKVKLTPQLMKSMAYIRKIGCSLYLKPSYHYKPVDQYLIDLDFKRLIKREDYNAAHLYYNKKVACCTRRQDTTVYNFLQLNPFSDIPDMCIAPIKDVYLGEIFKFDTEILVLKACNVLTLYQYIP